MVRNETFLERTYRENKDTIKFEMLAKNFKEIQSFLKFFEKRLNIFLCFACLF